MFTDLRSTRPVLAAAAGLLLLVVAGCSSGSDPVADGPAETETTLSPASTIVAGESPVTFSEIAAEAGLVYVQGQDALPPDCLFSEPGDGELVASGSGTEAAYRRCVAQRMTGGVAVGDVDGDGMDDLYFTVLGGQDVLYRNNGDGSFTDVTAAWGLDGFATTSNGAGFADLDNDGDQDLVVTTMADDRFYLFDNEGGRFTEVGEERGVALPSDAARRGFSVAFGDYDRDGWVDIHLTEWRYPEDFASGPAPHARLLRNLGPESPGFFEDVTEEAGVVLGDPSDVAGDPDQLPPFFEEDRDDAYLTASFASTFVDLDSDGWQDLAVTSDWGTSQLFWNNGDGTFTADSAGAGIAKAGNAMGSTFGDYDLDGDLDWFVTAIYDPAQGPDQPPQPPAYDGNRLYRNEGDRTFVEVAEEAGVLNGFWGWGAAFFDMDNDGALDLVMTNGQGSDNPMPIESLYLSPKRLWWNQGDGRFVDVAESAGIDTLSNGKGLAVFDLDLDGDLDIVMANTIDTPDLYRNEGDHENHWLRVSAEGSTTNRDAIGAVVEVETSDGTIYRREVGVGSHFLGQSERVAHFGLGPSDEPVDVVITWPASGRVQRIDGVTPDQVLEVTEPDG